MSPRLTLFLFTSSNFYVPFNFNLHRHLDNVVFFVGTNSDVNRGITVNSYNFLKRLVKNILVRSISEIKFDLRRLFLGLTAT